eukprot:Em0001g1512a
MHRELAIRLGDLANKWLKDVSTVEQIKDAVVPEQFNCLSSPIRVWIKERKPKSYFEAGKLADDYTEARKQVKEEKSNRDHNQKGKQSSTPSRSVIMGSSKEKCSDYGQRLRREDVVCFRCGSRAILHPSVQTRQCSAGRFQRRGVVEGKYMQDILLDTGCSKTLVYQSWYQRKRCSREAQEEKERCQEEADSQVSSSPVVLDAQSIAEEGVAIKPKETPERHQICEAEGDNRSVFNLEDSLFSGGRSRSKLSRSQKRAQRRIHRPAVEDQLSSGPLDMSAEELKQLVKLDPSLKNLKFTGTEEDMTHYYLDKGLSYRRWIPKKGRKEKKQKRKIFLNGEPKMCDQLLDSQKVQIRKLLHEFQEVMSSTPGRTSKDVHSIQITDQKPIRLAPYRLPHAYRELQRMGRAFAARKNSTSTSPGTTRFPSPGSGLSRLPIARIHRRHFMSSVDFSLHTGLTAKPQKCQFDMSQKLLPREQRYSTIEKKCLAMKLATQAFRVYLLGKPFTVQTDYRALEWLDKSTLSVTATSELNGASVQCYYTPSVLLPSIVSPPAYLSVQAPPSAPANLTVTALNVTSVLLAWGRPSGAPTPSLFYKVLVTSGNGTLVYDKTVKELQLILTTPDPCDQYWANVTAVYGNLKSIVCTGNSIMKAINRSENSYAGWDISINSFMPYLYSIVYIIFPSGVRV